MKKEKEEIDDNDERQTGKERKGNCGNSELKKTRIGIPGLY
jgi:hypothetical protein